MGGQSSTWWCIRASDALAARTESYTPETRLKVRSELGQCVREGEFPVDWSLEQPMTLCEESLAVFGYFFSIGSIYWLPVLVIILVYRALFPFFRPVRLCLIIGAILVAMYSPTPRWPGALRSRVSRSMMKYLSYTVIWYEYGDMCYCILMPP